MPRHPRRGAHRTTARAAAGALLLSLAAAGAAHAQGRPPLDAPPHPGTAPVTARATGSFDVKITPQPADAYADGAAIGRLTIDKEFRGDLQATSKGQMLSAMGGVKGSAGYVAIERVSGVLAGRRGTFVLQHSGTMTRGAPSLTVSVVPDSGTDELAGLTGTMTIDVSGGKHAYALEYALPAAP